MCSLSGWLRQIIANWTNPHFLIIAFSQFLFRLRWWMTQRRTRGVFIWCPLRSGYQLSRLSIIPPPHNDLSAKPIMERRPNHVLASLYPLTHPQFTLSVQIPWFILNLSKSTFFPQFVAAFCVSCLELGIPHNMHELVCIIQTCKWET